jgi:hypothetical protein
MKSSTATERQLCTDWGATLFRPSRADTAPTAYGLTQQHVVHAADCPGIAQGPQ